MSISDQIKQIEALRDKAIAARDRAAALAEKHAQEAAEYETAISVLIKLSPAPVAYSAAQSTGPATLGNFKAGSIATRILLIMRNSDQIWWTANELQDALGASGDPVKMTSISPNLSRLKDSGDIVRDDLKVALADRAPPNAEASEGDMLTGMPSEASKDTGPYQSGEPPAQGREAVPGGGT